MNEENKYPFDLADIIIQGPNGEKFKFDNTETIELTPIESDIDITDFGGPFEFEFEIEKRNVIFLYKAMVSIEGKEPEPLYHLELEFAADMPADEFEALEKRLKEYAETGKTIHIEKREVIKGRYENE